MSDYFQQIINILITSPGNLAYHLVLAFSLAAALQGALSQWRLQRSAGMKRAVVALSLLLAGRLVLFALAGVSWQGLINEHLFLPPVDRALSIFSAILIVWVWVFPEPQRLADAATGLLSLLTFTLLAMGLVWWRGQGQQMAFNSSWLGFLGGMVILAILAGGVLLLLIRRPSGWGIGLAMLILLILGDVAHLMFGSTQGDYAATVRLAQMAAYPLLLMLPQRASLPAVEPVVESPSLPEPVEPRLVFDPVVLPAVLALTNAGEPAEARAAAVRAVAHALAADVSLIIAADGEAPAQVLAAYDRLKGSFLPTMVLDSNGAAFIKSALQRGRPISLPGASAVELAYLVQTYRLERSGPLLLAPLPCAGTAREGLLLMNPVSNRGWRHHDETVMGEAAPRLAQLLHPENTPAAAALPEIDTNLNNEVAKLQAAAEIQAIQFQETLQAAQVETEQVRRERERLLDQLHALQEQDRSDHAQVVSLTALVSAQEEARKAADTSLSEANAAAAQLQSELQALQAELEALKAAQEVATSAASVEAAETAGALALLAQAPQEVESMDAAHYENELRLALEEIARLKASLSEADQWMLTQAQPPAAQTAAEILTKSTSADNHRMKEILTLAQDLRQPMSSIIGYTDFLMGESVGILGSLQRKFMERIKVSTERMNQLVDDLILASAVQDNQRPFDIQPVELRDILNSASAAAGPALSQKNVHLRTGFEKSYPVLHTDRETLQEVIVHLLNNAVAVTPENGEIYFGASLKRGEDDKDFFLIQVGDQGEGISLDDLPRVFSQASNNGQTSIPGLASTGLGLASVKALVETLEGRIWVDSGPGNGSVFSILLPLEAKLAAQEGAA